MSKKQKTTATATPWAEAMPLMRGGMDATQDLWNSGGFQTNPYQGARVAQLSPETMQGIGGLTAANPLTGATNNALLSNMNMDETYRNFDTIRGVTADNVKAQLASTFAGGGINSGMAQDTYTRAMTEALGGLEFGAYNDAKNRQLQAAGMAPSIAGMNRADAAGALTAGGIMDTQNQNIINADMAKYYEGENADLDALMKYANLGMGFGGMGKTGTESGSAPMDLGGILGGGGAFLQGLKLFSDERLKQNIWADDDRHIYNYLWSPVKFRGDLSKNVPERVIGQWLGFDVVEVR